MEEGADSMSKREGPDPGDSSAHREARGQPIGAPSFMTRLAVFGRRATRARLKVRPSGKTLRVSILAVVLAACVALGVYIHSLAPKIKLDGGGEFARDYDRAIEDGLTRAFTFSRMTKSAGSAVRDADPDGINWRAPDLRDRARARDNRARDNDSGGFVGLKGLDGLARDLGGLAKTMRGIADIKLKGLDKFDTDIDLEGFDRLDDFAQGLDAAVRPLGIEDPGEGFGVSQPPPAACSARLPSVPTAPTASCR